MSRFFKRNATIHNEMITKTQIALEAIKNYEARQYQAQQKGKRPSLHTYNNQKYQYQQYQRLRQHKQIKLDKNYIIQIFPFNQQYYFIDTTSYLFPMRIFVRNVKHSGTIYVGYDREFPGIGYDKASEGKQMHKVKKKNYSDKFEFDKDTVFILKNQKKKAIKKLYFTIIAHNLLLMFNLKFDYIGFEGMYQEQPAEKTMKDTKDDITSIDQKIIDFSQSPTKNKQQITFSPTITIKSPRIFTSDKRSKTQDTFTISPPKSLINTNINTCQSMTNKKNYIKLNFAQMPKYTKQNQKIQESLKMQKKKSSIEKNKINREQLIQFRQKQKQLKQFAFQLKQSINDYQNVYRKLKTKNCSLTKLVSSIIYSNVFIAKINDVFNEESGQITKNTKIRNLTKKFTSKIKNSINSSYPASNIQTRIHLDCFHILQLTTKFIAQPSKNQAEKQISSLFDQLFYGLLLNDCLVKSTKYRQSVRLIQKKWIVKFHARLQMLVIFSQHHIELMIKQYPHLKLGLSTYQSGPYCHKVCYQYLIEQSTRFHHTYSIYKKKLAQITEYTEINQLITQYNKTKSSSKKKKYLDIPRKPPPPQHRFFRNLDILRSMLRGWFQLEYKKIIKRSVANN